MGALAGIRRSVVARMLAALAALGTFLFLLVAAVEHLRDRAQLVEDERARGRAAVTAGIEPVALALWNYDQRALALNGQSLTQAGVIVRVEVRSYPDGALVSATERPGGGAPSATWELPLWSPTRRDQIGVLRIGESLAGIDRLVWLKAPGRITAELVKVAVIAAGVFLLLHRLVIRRLVRLVAQLGGLAMDDPEARVTETEPRDEIGTLAEAINRFQHDRATAMQRRRQAEADLQERMREVSATLGALREGVIGLDAGGVVRYANDAARALLQSDVDGAPLASTLRVLRDGRDVDLAGLLAAVRDRRAAELRGGVALQLSGEEPRPIELHVSPVEGGGDVALIVVIRDLSAQTRVLVLEREKEVAEAASRAKSELLSRMSHELRTPLHAILGFAQSLQAEPGVAEAQRERLASIAGAGWHLVRMISDLLDLSRIESGGVRVTPAPVDLRSAVREALALVAEDAARDEIRLRDAIDERAAWVTADAVRLTQVLVNLFSNAVKYNRPGGAVWVTSGAGPGGRVLLSVRDEGIGMSEAQLARLYEPFDRLGRETSGKPGTGIGLVITRRLLELMGGTIEVRSAPGQGSEFSIDLPRAEAPGAPAPSATPAAAAPTPRAGGPRRILYVEDSAINAEVMKAMLERRPELRLEVVATLADGYERLRREPPDLLLLDMQLPDGLGLDLLHRLRADPALAGVKVAVVSADLVADRVDAAIAAGASAYLGKPFDFDEALRLIDSLLAGAG